MGPNGPSNLGVAPRRHECYLLALLTFARFVACGMRSVSPSQCGPIVWSSNIASAFLVVLRASVDRLWRHLRAQHWKIQKE